MTFNLSGTHIEGCMECDCINGTSLSTACGLNPSGQCDCIPRVSGRRCDQPDTGFFIPKMDYIKVNTAATDEVCKYSELINVQWLASSFSWLTFFAVMFTYLKDWAYKWIYTRVYIYACAYIRACIYTRVYIYARVYIRACIYTRVYIYARVYIRACIYTRVYIYARVYIRVCIYTRVYITV